MAPTVDVGKLRQVLDYLPCETCLDVYSPDQDYLCGICARINRDVAVRQLAVGHDEAVQVIAPEEFSMAQGLREKSEQQQRELEETRAGLARLQARETELEEEVRRLQAEILERPAFSEEMQAAPEPELVPFDFVGVRKEKPPEPVMEFSEEPESATEEPTSPAGEGQWEEVPTEQASAPANDAIPTFEQEGAEQAPIVRAPPPSPRAAKAEEAITRIETELGKIEEELALLSAKEKELARRTGNLAEEPGSGGHRSKKK